MGMLCYPVLIKDPPEKDTGDLAEEFVFFDLVRKEFLLVDNCRDKEEAMLSKLLLATTKEGCPVFFEARDPLLTKLSLH